MPQIFETAARDFQRVDDILKQAGFIPAGTKSVHPKSVQGLVKQASQHIGENLRHCSEQVFGREAKTTAAEFAMVFHQVSTKNPQHRALNFELRFLRHADYPQKLVAFVVCEDTHKLMWNYLSVYTKGDRRPPQFIPMDQAVVTLAKVSDVGATTVFAALNGDTTVKVSAEQIMRSKILFNAPLLQNGRQ